MGKVCIVGAEDINIDEKNRRFITGGGTGIGMLKEGLQAHLMQRVAADGMNLDPARLCYLVTRAGAEAVGLADAIRYPDEIEAALKPSP